MSKPHPDFMYDLPPLAVVETEPQYKAALEVCSTLTREDPLATSARARYLKVLATLISDYEMQMWPKSGFQLTVDPGVTLSELAKVLGEGGLFITNSLKIKRAENCTQEPAREKCWGCQGTGIIGKPGVDGILCKFCNGYGYKQKVAQTCPHCLGSGKTLRPDLPPPVGGICAYAECKRCEGTGKIGDGWSFSGRTCPSCYGTGLADRRERIKQRAYEIDPPCWVSYSGKDRAYKQAMEKRRRAALQQAEDEFNRI